MVKDFKQTEIGLIPEDWEIVNLSEIGNVITGLTYSPNDVRDFGILVLRSSNIQENTLVFENNVYVDMQLPERVIVKEKDLLICVRNGSRNLIGKSVLIDKQTEGSAFGAFMSIYRSVFNGFVSYAFQSDIIQKQIENNLGATINQITNKDLKSFKIPLPPLSEQEAIAAALSDADAWIESLEQLIAKKRLIKHGAMQALLTPKEGWEVKKLGEAGDIIIGLTYSPLDVSDYGVLVLRSANIQNNKLAFENNVFVKMDLPERVIVKENDLLVCVRNGSKQLIGKCALIDKKTEGQAFGAFMSIVRSHYGPYLYYYFQTHHIQTQIDENLGATINQLTNATLKRFEINIPRSVSEQQRIATILSEMDAEMEALEQQLAKARQIKQGMMQELLTGRVRLV